MLFEASHVARVTPLPARPAAPPFPPAAPGRFAHVYDLALERERRTVPPEAIEAVAEAARACERLDAAGLEVRFDLSGGLSATLCRPGGDAVRALTLHEVVDPTSLLPPDAA